MNRQRQDRLAGTLALSILIGASYVNRDKILDIVNNFPNNVEQTTLEYPASMIIQTDKGNVSLDCILSMDDKNKEYIIYCNGLDYNNLHNSVPHFSPKPKKYNL